MYISDERRMVYLAAPKTASKATASVLRERGFKLAKHLPNSHPVKVLGTKTHSHHQTLTEHPGEGWTVFTTVRNHWDTFVSWFTYQNKTGVQFDEAYIDRIASGYPMYYPDDDKLWSQYTRFADAVLRYESLQEDFNRMLGRATAIPRVNISPGRGGRHYSVYYDDALRLYVAERFREEIEDYGYHFEAA